jgi:hypothetical protein
MHSAHRQRVSAARIGSAYRQHASAARIGSTHRQHVSADKTTYLVHWHKVFL